MEFTEEEKKQMGLSDNDTKADQQGPDEALTLDIEETPRETL